jgi:molecular chaperone DnaK
VEVHVLQGERDMAGDNKPLGRFNLTGIPPAPRGVPQIEVTFDIDANGIVSVSAKDLGTGKIQQITITGGTALPRDDIDRMVRDAESHADEDRVRRETAEARNQGDHTAYQTEKMLKDYGDKLSEGERSQIQSRIDDLRAALKEADASPDRLRKATEAVMTASQILGQRVYEASKGQAAGPSGGTATPGAEEVVEAEIVDEGDQPR